MATRKFSLRLGLMEIGLEYFQLYLQLLEYYVNCNIIAFLLHPYRAPGFCVLKGEHAKISVQ